jgi:polyvinyl alcohol dehydrogenase (cytochrome)
MDFGSSPNLFRRNGRLAVGEMQKSGVYHVVDAATMAPIWRTVVGAPFTFANGASSATDGTRVYLDALPGVLSALDTLTGRVLWAASTADAVHFEAITVADGVIYTVDTGGFLDAFDAGTGVQLLKRPLVLDNGADPRAVANYTSASVSVARHTLYVASSGTLLAYEP